jgi:hypothetical protein
MDERLEKVHLVESKPVNLDTSQFDLFHMKDSTPEEQREFELWWHKWTGRSAIVISGVDYLTTLPYPEGK